LTDFKFFNRCDLDIYAYSSLFKFIAYVKYTSTPRSKCDFLGKWARNGAAMNS